jgi:hypothetical protein
MNNRFFRFQHLTQWQTAIHFLESQWQQHNRERDGHNTRMALECKAPFDRCLSKLIGAEREERSTGYRSASQWQQRMIRYREALATAHKNGDWTHSFTASQWRATISTFRSRYRQRVASEKNVQYLLAISTDMFLAVSKITGSSRKVLDNMDIYNAFVDGKRVLSEQGFEIASRSTLKAWTMVSCGSQDKTYRRDSCFHGRYLDRRGRDVL